jgi:hypothetical protein
MTVTTSPALLEVHEVSKHFPGVQALDHRTFWRHYDQSFVGRNYFRIQEPPAACDKVVTTSMAVSPH